MGGQVSISDCLFDGTLTGSSTTGCAGFVGWLETNNNAAVNLQRCYFNPAEVNLGGDCKTFVRTRNNAYITRNHIFYGNPLGVAQGTDASSMDITTLHQNLGSEGWEVSGTQRLPVGSGGSTTLVPKTNKEPANITYPVFDGVTINNTTNNVETESVDFIGSYDPVNIAGEDKTMLYIGAGNTLYYPDQAMTINACRAHFRLKGITAGDPTSDVRSFVLNFGHDATGIVTIENGKLKIENEAGAWYSLDGRKLSDKPTKKGVYINGGRKVVMK
jgi:hypothetical protein